MEHKCGTHQLRTGDWVEVLSKQEILQTLDEHGMVDHLPFMPEMFEYCRRRFRVQARAHKTCDTVNKTGGRRLSNAVHLEGVRCDGAAHGKCQAACLIFWKECWLRKVDAPALPPNLPGGQARSEPEAVSKCSEADVMRATLRSGRNSGSDAVYSCQATCLPEATTALSGWDMSQYWEDVTSGNVSFHRLVSAATFATFERILRIGIGGRLAKRCYNAVQKLVGGSPYPRGFGQVPPGVRTPGAELNLQPGELVRVKSFDAILATLDGNNKNRGLYFDAEEVPFCGKTYRVWKRVDQIIDEKTGRMLKFNTPSVLLENVYCQGRYSCGRLLCPRAILSMWREVWLERVPIGDLPANSTSIEPSNWADPQSDLDASRK